LLTEWCAGQDIVDLLLAHHRDDQAETFLLRLGRGSGIDGLACMAPVSASPVAEPSGVRLLRPLLPVQKSRLIATAESLNIPWVEDPSNRDTAFARVRVRDALTGLAEEGLTSQRLAAAARRMERASHALRAATQELLAGSIRRDRAGYCEIGLEDFFRAPDEIALRALGQMLQWVGGPEATPRLERLERLYERLATAGPFGGRTLGGCRIHVRTGASGHRLRVFREPEAADQVLPLPPGTGGVWDGRFRVALTSGGVESGEAAVVRRLGDEGWREIAPAVPDKVRRQLPALARPSLPALWDRTGVLSVPLAGYQRPETGLESRFNLGVFTTEAAWRGAPEELA
jgi:tRNA(Ile)-lysidine synthase